MSGVIMKIKMSPTNAGKLFQRACALEDEVALLKLKVGSLEARLWDSEDHLEEDALAKPLREWIQEVCGRTITGAASVLRVNRSTLHRVMDTAYVIDGRLYTIKRKTS